MSHEHTEIILFVVAILGVVVWVAILDIKKDVDMGASVVEASIDAALSYFKGLLILGGIIACVLAFISAMGASFTN